MEKEILEEAWKLRRIGIYTMRDIANKLGVNREQLIQELEAYLLAQSNKGLQADVAWACAHCGRKNTGNVCSGCGYGATYRPAAKA